MCDTIIISAMKKIKEKARKGWFDCDYDSYNLDSFYMNMNIKFLKTLLKKRGYKRYSKLNKKELVEMFSS